MLLFYLYQSTKFENPPGKVLAKAGSKQSVPACRLKTLEAEGPSNGINKVGSPKPSDTRKNADTNLEYGRAIDRARFNRSAGLQKKC
jgi:hypothetical protein